MKTTIGIVLVGIALAAGFMLYKNSLTPRHEQAAATDPVLKFAMEHADTLREQGKENREREERQAKEREMDTKELNSGIEREPENADLRVKRARMYDAQGNHEAALRDIEVALRTNFPQRYHLLYMRHKQLNLLGRPQEALADVLAAIELAPPEFSYHLSAAELHRQLGSPEAGVAVFDAALRQYPDNLFIRSNRARFVASLGRYEEAINEMTPAIESEPDESQRYIRTLDRIKYLTAVRRFDEALADANQLLKQRPRDTVVLHARGDVYKAMGDARRAEADYDTAMNISMDR